MLLENSLKKYKEIPEAIKQIVGLVSLTVAIIFTFMILNIFIDESDIGCREALRVKRLIKLLLHFLEVD